MSKFDHYFEWLEIPPEDQPPNHYRLLGLKPFEDDTKAINTAADQHSAHVRKFQLSRHSKQSQKLLNEIAAARVCLTKPKAKKKYDRSLRELKQKPLASRPAPLSRQRKPTSKRRSAKPATSSTGKILAVPMSVPAEPEIEQLPDLPSADSLSLPIESLDSQPLQLQPLPVEPVSTELQAQPLVKAPAEPVEKRSGLSSAVLWGIAGAGGGTLLLGIFFVWVVITVINYKPDIVGKKAGQKRQYNGLKLNLHWCPPGTFMMGSLPSEDQSQETLTQGFWMGETEVTQDQWKTLMLSMPWRGKQGPNYPATWVSWEDAMAFCKKLTEQERQAGRLPDHWEYILPNEMQWEYACRAGTQTRFSFQEHSPDSSLDDYAWYSHNAGGLRGGIHEVGEKPPNPWGLYDMHGNVSEWCRDDADTLLEGSSLQWATSDANRACRGGSHNSDAMSTRSASQNFIHPSNQGTGLGFRVALVPTSSTSVPVPKDPPETESITNDPVKANFIGKQAGQERQDNDLKLTLCWCPPGTFTMGSPKSEQGRDNDEDQVQVTLTQGFWLGKTEVTQGQWQALMSTTPWRGVNSTKERTDYPATDVSWEDAASFCKKLTEQERRAGRLPGGWEYQLPTEAQWEYACRAGTTTRFYFGDDDSHLSDYAWFDENIGVEKYAHEVGKKRPNAWGLHDIHGNMLEWCRDRYASKLSEGTDPQGATTSGDSRVTRSGSWLNSSRSSRSASRDGGAPSYRNSLLGFRLALVPTGK